ncbi:MAG: hypothetical protein COA69_07495 [Robiginitomaculum sp.]|nr:MAG: hypothetical protein COA69_07495 [Robiginitomaculum sp.]
MGLPLIHEDWTFLLWAALMLLATLGFWADRTKIGANISGVAIILMAAMALSNLGVLPKSAKSYDVIWAYLVPLAIPLLLLKADLRRVFTETKGMLLAFMFGAVGTSIGAVLGYYILPLGDQADKLAGVFSATYIGGSMNMAAVTQAVELDPSIVTASVAADNVIGVLYLAFLALVPAITLFRRWFKYTDTNDGPVINQVEDKVTIDLRHIGLTLGLSFLICAAGKALASTFGISGYSIMFITAITILIANIFPRQLKALQGDYEMGLFCMYLFFAAIGISADLGAMLDKALIIAVYALLIIVCHAVVIFGAGKLFKLDLMDIVIASNACASGPASAAALAAGKGRRDLVVPAVLLGVFGYAVANFVGIGLTAILA